jgi:hypothetical protein
MNTLLLPSGATKTIRDAARAAKRTAGLMVKRVTADTLSILLGLPGMVVTEYALEKQDGREILHIFCQHEHEVAQCPRCGQISQALHEETERCVRLPQSSQRGFWPAGRDFRRGGSDHHHVLDNAARQVFFDDQPGFDGFSQPNLITQHPTPAETAQHGLGGAHLVIERGSITSFSRQWRKLHSQPKNLNPESF